ncbi:hypothetical protein AB4059_14270 [Lysobacter sp. 2RAF19]
MKRRSFIQAALLSIPATQAAATDRLFGTPGSVAIANKRSLRFALPLERSGVPRQFWAQLDAIATSIHDAMRSATQGRALSEDPANYLRSRGLDTSDRTLSDESVRLAVALSDPHIKHAIAIGDYTNLFNLLEAAGMLNRPAPSILQKRVETILSDNAAELRQHLDRRRTAQDIGLLGMLNDGSAAATIDDLSATREFLSRGIYDPTRMAVVISIVAAVVTAVVAVMVAVIVAIPVVAYGVAAAARIARLDPILMDNYQRLSHVGTIIGDQRLTEHALREVIRAEAVAVVDAMRAMRLMSIPDSARDEAIDVLALYAWKAAGA